MAGAVLAWARALGEFGATITFAGNYPGRTQTMPLAIYLARESDTSSRARAQPGADRGVVRGDRRAARAVARAARPRPPAADQSIRRDVCARRLIAVRRGTLDLHVALTVERGELVAVLGPNGSGKSTLLRCIAGLLPIDAGSIEVDGTVLDDASTDQFVPPERRPIGVVFQDYLLFAHLSALENVAFGLRARGTAKRRGARNGPHVARPGRTRRSRRAPARGAVRGAGAAGRPRPGARHRPGRAAARRTTGRPRRRHPRHRPPRPAPPPRVVRRDAPDGDPRPGRRLRPRRPRRGAGARRDRADRHARRGRRRGPARGTSPTSWA